MYMFVGVCSQEFLLKSAHLFHNFRYSSGQQTEVYDGDGDCFSLFKSCFILQWDLEKPIINTSLLLAVLVLLNR